MIVTHKMVLDMEQAGDMLRIDAVQDDRYTRNVELTLTAGGSDWNVPETASVVVRYRKADGIGGQYDALPDGSRAWNADGNVVTVALAPQMLTVPGPVTVSVGFLDKEQEINTFGFLINVQPNAGAQIVGSESYYHVQGFLPQPEAAAEGQFLQITGINDQGVITQMAAVDAPIGEPGENGGTFTPVVSTDGVLSWSNDKGLENPRAVNIRGPQGKTGDTGPAGPRGEAAVSPVARVTETEDGVEIRITDEFGTSKATVLHGKDGERGPQGEQGDSSVLTIAYQVSSSKYQSGLDHSAWSATIPTMSETNKYLWAKIEITTGALCVEKYGILGVYGETGAQGPQGIQGIQGEKGRTPGIWLAPKNDSAFVLQYGAPMSDMVGTVAASADTVFDGDMILCSDGGVVLVKGFNEEYSGWVLCQGAKDEADLTAGAAVNLKGADGADGNRIWLTEDSSESVKMDGVYFTHLTGAKDATKETVFPGDLLITADGDLMSIKSVMELNNNSLGVAMVSSNVISLKGADGANGADGATGTTPALTIGTVQTGEPGTDAVAIITGTAENPVLSMRIPRGADGGASTTVVTVGFANCDFICDGVDDDVEIQAAIDSLPDSGGTVKLAAGDYYLSSTIASAKNNVRIVGEVNSTTTLISSKPSVNLHGSKILFNPSGWNWQFCEISFLGENATSWGKYGLNLLNAKGSIRVERCVFSGWNGGICGVDASNGADLTVHGGTVTGCTYGIYNPENATVIGCVITDCGTGIYNPMGCAIHGNTIRDCDMGIGPVYYGKNTITGNTVTRGNGTAADYTGEQHTIQLGYVDLDGKTMLYGWHNCITGNFLHGKDVTVAETTQEGALAELASCIISDNGGAQDSAICPETVYNGRSMPLTNCKALVSGKGYEVCFNGNSYMVVGVPTTYDGEACTALGNLGLLGGEDSGEPFLILQDDETTVFVSSLTTETTVAVFEPEVPYFDLDAMGLPVAEVNGELVAVGIDTTEICAACAKGTIRIKFLGTHSDMTIPINAFVNPVMVASFKDYALPVIAIAAGMIMVADISVEASGAIRAMIKAM